MNPLPFFSCDRITPPPMAYPRKSLLRDSSPIETETNQTVSEERTNCNSSSRKRFVENVGFFGHGEYIYIYTRIWRFRAGFAIFRPLNGKLEEVEGKGFPKRERISHIFFFVEVGSGKSEVVAGTAPRLRGKERKKERTG